MYGQNSKLCFRIDLCEQQVITYLNVQLVIKVCSDPVRPNGGWLTFILQRLFRTMQQATTGLFFFL